MNQIPKKRVPLTPIRPMRIGLDAPTDEVRIELIPLIDVIFCILTFFILAAVGLSRQQAINVDLPKASTGAPQMRDLLIVSLDNASNVYIEQNQVFTKDQFAQAIKTYKTKNPNGLMVLSAAKEASYDEVVQLLDQMRDLGGDRVALATLPGASETPTQPQVPTVPLEPLPLPSYTAPTVPTPPAQLGTPQPTVPPNSTSPQLEQPGTSPSNPALPSSPSRKSTQPANSQSQ